MAEPDWSLYRTFLAVMRAGSLSRAAQSLGLTQPSVGRQVVMLESQLGTSLFSRSPQGLQPTETAEALRSLAETMEASAAAIGRAATGGQKAEAGVVRLSASEVIAAEVLPTILVKLSADSPGLVFELEASNENADLLRRDADIAVRMARPTQSALIARKIGEIEVGLYAHQAYLAGCGAPNSISELLAGSFIGFDRRIWPHIASMDIRRDVFRFRVDNDLVAHAMLRAGFGVGGMQAPLAAQDKNLVRVLPELSFPLAMWLVMHEDLKGVRRIRRVFEALVEMLTVYVSCKL